MAILKWGIIGPGFIAHRFMDSLKTLPDTELVACASLTPGKAEKFSKQYGSPKWYTSYEELVKDRDIDAVYISTTNQNHMDSTLLALNNGKHVLCEKPLAVNAGQVRKVIDTARNNGLFLMEAMWSRFFPLMKKLEELLFQRIIGDIRVIVGDFSYSMPGLSMGDSSFRGFDPNCAGGGLIDVGIYVLSIACKLLGKTPDRVSGLATMSPLNVDAHSVAVFGFNGGEIVSAYSGLDADSTSEMTVYGSAGYIRIPDFWHADTMHIHKIGQEILTIQMPFEAPGFQYEITEVQRCISEGLLESPVMPLDESLAIIEAFDKLRLKWGLIYPCD